MIAGRYPFEGNHPLKVMENIKKGSYSLPKGIKISKNCSSLIEKLLRVDPNKRITFDDFFNNPFISTEPEVYLKNLQIQWGEDYGMVDPLEVKEIKEVNSPQKHYEKSELIPQASVDLIDMEYELIDAKDVDSDNSNLVKKRSPEEKDFNPFIEDVVKDYLKEENRRSDRFKEEIKYHKNNENEEEKKVQCGVSELENETPSIEMIIDYYKRAVTNVIEEAENINNALVIQKDSLGKAFDNIKFILVVHILKRVKALLIIFQKNIPKNKKYILIYSQKKFSYYLI